MRLQFLAERIRQRTANKTDTQVFVRSDGQLEVQDLIDVLDQLKAAGVQTAGIVTELPRAMRRSADRHRCLVTCNVS